MKKILKSFYKLVRSRLIGEGVINFRGKGIINFIDIGSAGNLPSPWNKNAKYIKHLLSFEPRSKYKINKNILTMDVALWKTNTEKDFYIYKGREGSGSSLFKQNYEYVSENFQKLRVRGPEHLASSWFERSKLQKKMKVKCRKLDDIIHEIDQPFRYHFLKIDAQGAEFEILKGSEGFLTESCLGLQLELFVLPLYDNIKLLPEVEAYLDKMNFELVKKFPAHGSFDSQHDCVFFKKGAKNQIMKKIQQVYSLDEGSY